MRYIAKDLNEIAEEFEKRAATAARYAENASLLVERRNAESECRVWNEAAVWLRDTELRPEVTASGAGGSGGARAH